MANGTVTLVDLRARALFRADIEPDAVTTEQLDPLINAAIRRLWGTRTSANPAAHAVYSTPAAATAGAGGVGVAVPDDFFRLLRVDAGSSASGGFARLRAFAIQEEQLEQGAGPLGECRYQLRNGRVILTPQPASGVYLRLLYIPLAPTLTEDGDDREADFVNGWEEVVILDVAAALLTREQNADGAAAALRERDRRQKEIEAEVANLDAGEPMHVVDVRGYD